MIKIGITGGIGSGKSVVCDIFLLHNIPVYDADKEAKLLTNTSDVIRDKLINHFGNVIYKDNELNRKLFGELIFNNEDNLKIANSIIHPEVANSFLKWCQNHSSSSIVAIESAILIEAGFKKYIDKLITVCAPKELRINRVVNRDNTSVANIKARINNQISEDERIRFSDYIIYNDNSRSLILQVSDIINNL
ncbi:MAG: dephospho-CoA kinase [Fermentimonas sp.]|nr:dephospho-CoA kinase [Fermentimonas sp.]